MNKPESKDGSHLLARHDKTIDFLRTLMNCQGYYSCPTNGDGRPLKSIVPYKGTYMDGSEEK